MWKNWLIVAFIFKMVFNTGFAQSTHVVNDPEKAFKQMKDHFVKIFQNIEIIKYLHVVVNIYLS